MHRAGATDRHRHIADGVEAEETAVDADDRSLSPMTIARSTAAPAGWTVMLRRSPTARQVIGPDQVIASTTRSRFHGAVGRAMGSVMSAALALMLAGCALPEAADDVLEPMHGTIDPEVLTRRAEPAAVAVPSPPDDSVRWRVANAIDGRTLELYQGLDRATATLGGIEVPTGDECLAQRATDSLAFITGGGRSFEVTPPTARNGRIDDATIIGDDGDDLAAVMLSLGLARPTVGAGDRRSAYEAAEAAAQEAELGIWSDDCDD
jgi:hypothetical protein